jgi:branched-chain amino acid transport system ATP-binding protein
VDVEVKAGEIVTMIGANGAGKSTLMMTICGNPKPRSGRIVFDGRDITNLPTHQIMRLGIAQSPEGRRIFPRMSVMENLQMGAMLVDEKREFRSSLRSLRSTSIEYTIKVSKIKFLLSPSITTSSAARP